MNYLVGFAKWLAASPLTALVTAKFWIVPSIQIIHILAIAAVVIGVALIDLRALGLIEQDRAPNAVLRQWLPVIYVSTVILAITGFLLIASEPGRALFRTVFWVKLGLIVLALLVTRALGSAGGNSVDGAPTPVRRILAVTSLLLWIGAIWAGRWIAYADGWPGAPN